MGMWVCRSRVEPQCHYYTTIILYSVVVSNCTLIDRYITLTVHVLSRVRNYVNSLWTLGTVRIGLFLKVWPAARTTRKNISAQNFGASNQKGTSLMPVRLVETSRFLDNLYFLCSCGEKSSGEDVVFSL